MARSQVGIFFPMSPHQRLGGRVSLPEVDVYRWMVNHPQPPGEHSESATAVSSGRGTGRRTAAGSRSRGRFSLAWSRLRWWQEVLIIGLGYLVYELIQGTAPVKKDASAFTNSHDIDRLERWTHLDPERWINHVTNARPALASLTGYYYDSMHYVITPVVLLWLWRMRPALYARWRSALVLASMSALVVFWSYPVAPPRMAVPGIIDTLVVRHIMGTVAKSGSTGGIVNQYAAMPSLHVGWSLWCAAAIVGTTRVWWRQLAWLYPVATTLVVMATGNHYLLDGLGGAVAIVLGMLLTPTAAASAWRHQQADGGTGSRAPTRPEVT